MSTSDPRIDLIQRIGEQMDAMRYSRNRWMALAILLMLVELARYLK